MSPSKEGISLAVWSRTAALLLVFAASLGAASGGPDALGYTWRDIEEGCVFDIAGPGLGGLVVPSPTEVLGPRDLGFTMPFHGRAVSRIWISPQGYVTFSDQGPSESVPQTLPDPSPPNDLIAALWNGDPVEEVAFGPSEEGYVVRWAWPAVFGQAVAVLELFPSGDHRLSWGGTGTLSAFSVFGRENEDGTEGTTYFQDGIPVAPDFPNSITQNAVCVAAPRLLDCSAPREARCGEVLDGGLGDDTTPNALAYTCSLETFPAEEEIVALETTAAQAVSLRLDDPSQALLRVPEGPDCREDACIDTQGGDFELPFLARGRHFFSLDSRDAAGGPYRLEVLCDPLSNLSCGAVETAGTTGGLDREASTCAPVDLTGPEIHRSLDLPAGGHARVLLEPPVPGLWVVLRDVDGRCLAAGEGGAAAFNLPPGEIVVTVDGADGAEADFDLRVDCGVQLDCAEATEIGCLSLVEGDTRGAPDVASLYPCAAGRFDGGEAVHRLQLAEGELVSARLLEGQPGQEVLVLDGCDEGACVGAGPVGACGELPAGEVLVVVDGPAGSEGPFTLQVACGRGLSSGADLAVGRLDLSGLDRTCRDLEVGGVLRAPLANLGTEPVPPPVVLEAYEDRDASGDFDPAVDALLGSATVPTILGVAEEVVVEIPVTGETLFRDSILGARIVPGVPAVDQDPSNDVADTALACRGPAGPVSFAPALEWEWTSSPVQPESNEILSAPVVADLDGDESPEIIVVTHVERENEGVVRAFSGVDGTELWTATDPAASVLAVQHPAVADIDGDGTGEVLAVAGVGEAIVAIDAAGEVLMTTEPLPFVGGSRIIGGISVADIDADTSPEIIFGRQVYRSDGSFFWTPEEGGTNGEGFSGPISIPVDLDGDGILEILAGPTAYRWNPATGMGEILWRTPDLPDGHVAVGDFDADHHPEVVLTNFYRVHLIEGDTGALRWSVDLPQGDTCEFVPPEGGGPPAVADVDGDGAQEIAVAGSDLLSVFEGNGELLWSSPIDDCSSAAAGVVAFDFDGDGAAELVHQDERAVRIFRGADGTELAALPSTSGTNIEQAVVADVDGDGAAEIVTGQNDFLKTDGSGRRGLQVFGGSGGGWVSARPLWSQHGYHPAALRDDLSAPAPSGLACQAPSPIASGGFRVQRGGESNAPPAPDLTLAVQEVTGTKQADCTVEARLVVRIGNAGSASSAATTVAFYDGDPGTGGSLLDLLDLAPLAPGETRDLETVFSVESLAGSRVVAVADDDGTGAELVAECREDNNACDLDAAGIATRAVEPPGPVGNALRATGHLRGPSEVTATFDWSRDESGPRPLGTDIGEFHYHWYRAVLDGGPPAFTQVTDPEPLLGVTHTDATARTPVPDQPRVHAYLVRAADFCEIEEP